MDEKTKKSIELHVAGATVRHKSPFEDLKHYESEEDIDIEFIDKWVAPFYMTGLSRLEFVKNYKPIRPELNNQIIKKLLGDFNWRTRIVGAYFSAIENLQEFEDIIGVHLLKSQVCYAGHGYCLALATFNTEKSIDYLKKYLNYYLAQKHLQFNQRDALCALNWLDKINNTNEVSQFIPLYKNWVTYENDQNIDNAFNRFDKAMQDLEQIREITKP